MCFELLSEYHLGCRRQKGIRKARLTEHLLVSWSHVFAGAGATDKGAVQEEATFPSASTWFGVWRQVGVSRRRHHTMMQGRASGM